MKNVRCIFYASLQCWKASSVSDALKSCLRSSYQMCSIIKGVLTNFAKFTGKHPCQSLFLNKVAVPFLQNTSYCLRICWPTFLTVSIVSSFEKRINPLLPSVTFLYPLAVFGSLHTKNEVSHEGFLQKMWPDPQFPADLVTFTEKILIGKLHFLCSGCFQRYRNVIWRRWVKNVDKI